MHGCLIIAAGEVGGKLERLQLDRAASVFAVGCAQKHDALCHRLSLTPLLFLLSQSLPFHPPTAALRSVFHPMHGLFIATRLSPHAYQACVVSLVTDQQPLHRVLEQYELCRRLSPATRPWLKRNRA